MVTGLGGGDGKDASNYKHKYAYKDILGNLQVASRRRKVVTG